MITFLAATDLLTETEPNRNMLREKDMMLL